MTSIVCATRAGEGSRAVQMTAINRAKAEGQTLTFLYVIDPASLGEVDAMLWEPLRQELIWMGKTLLHIAEKRADDADLKAQIVIREGTVRDEICTFVTETNAKLLLLGAPRGTSANIFGDDEIEVFARSIHDTTGVPVEIIRPETVTESVAIH